MNKNKHLTLSERVSIEKGLNNRLSFKGIGRELSKDPTTISKEIKNHLCYKRTGAYGRPFNDCNSRNSCTAANVCGKHVCRNRMCKFCTAESCTVHCILYEKEICRLLSKPPYVCNGCEKRRSCTLEKRLYTALDAQREYEAVRSESRQGLQITETDAKRVDSILSPLLRKGQSIHHICINHRDELMYDERTLYNYVDYGIFSARNIDMPRKVRMGKRHVRKAFKVDKGCRIGRTYNDFEAFLRNHPYVPVVEMDSVEGTKGGKVLLTLHFTIPQLMLAFIRDSNTSQSVINIFDRLYMELRPDIFCKLFGVVLGDNGSEFSNPKAIEFDTQGNRWTNVFYCDPSSPFQKGAIENNHELIHRVIPQGKSLNDYTQGDIDLMMSHINSYGRENLGDKTPYKIFATLYGEEIVKKLGVTFIPPDEVTLHPSLLKK